MCPPFHFMIQLEFQREVTTISRKIYPHSRVTFLVRIRYGVCFSGIVCTAHDFVFLELRRMLEFHRVPRIGLCDFWVVGTGIPEQSLDMVAEVGMLQKLAQLGEGFRALGDDGFCD